jgi:O-antigen/teichoic acid export membrane protein
VQFVVGVALARLLGPSEYGLAALALVFVGVVNLVADAGLTSTLVQKRGLNDDEQGAVFWFSFVFSSVLALALAASGQLIADITGTRALQPILVILSATTLMTGPSAVLTGRLERSFRFRDVSVANVAATTVSGVVGVAAALLGAGVWALVVQYLSWVTIKLAVLAIQAHWFPPMRWSVPALVSSIAFARFILASNIMNYAGRNADNLLIANSLGTVALGYYNQAYKLLLVPLQLLTWAAAPSLHAVFSSMQEDPKKMLALYARVMRLLLTLGFSLAAFLFVAADEIVLGLWGEKWTPSVPVFRLLAPITALQVASATLGALLMARNKAGLHFSISSATTICFVTAFAISAPHGIEAVALAYLLANVVVAPISMQVTLRACFGSSLTILMGAFLVALAASLSVAGVTLGLLTLFAFLEPLARLAAVCLALTVVGYVVFRTRILATIDSLRPSRLIAHE